jgi:hypothetical protein
MAKSMKYSLIMLVVIAAVSSRTINHHHGGHERLINKCLYTTLADRTFPTIAPSACDYIKWVMEH